MLDDPNRSNAVSVSIQTAETLIPSSAPLRLGLELVDHIRRRGAREIFSASDIRKRTLVYVVTNGPHILHVGEGQHIRLQALMRDGSPMLFHQKLFIVAASYVLHGPGIRYFYIPVKSKVRGHELERELHQKFDEHFIEGIESRSRYYIAQALAEQLRARQAILSDDVNFDRLNQNHWSCGEVLASLRLNSQTRPWVDRVFNGYFL